MTKEQEEAIEKLKRELNNLEYTKDLDMASDNYFGQFEERINTIETILSMLEEKDKQIDLMAELIAKKAGARIEICHNMHCKENSEIECKKCAKEYFLNIVKKEE